MTAPLRYFVCDRCGNYWTAYRSARCPACRETALWMFPTEQPAREHAALIIDRTRAAGKR